jgi:hypothetical protein
MAGGPAGEGAFRVDASQPLTVPALKDTQRLGIALLCYLQMLPPSPDEPPVLQRWRHWALARLSRGFAYPPLRQVAVGDM